MITVKLSDWVFHDRICRVRGFESDHCLEWHEAPSGTYILPEETRTGGFFTFKSFEFKNSISSSVSGHSKSGVIRFRRKVIDLNRYLRVPVKPRAFPPREHPRKARPIQKKYKPFVEPKKLYSWSKPYSPDYINRARLAYNKRKAVFDKKQAAYFKRQLDIWLQLDARCQRRAAAYKVTFAKRLQKYAKRMEILKKRREIVSNWKHRPPLVFSKLSSGFPENPYTRERISAFNTAGEVVLASLGRSFRNWDQCLFFDAVYTWYPYLQTYASKEAFADALLAGLEGTDNTVLQPHVDELSGLVCSKLRSKIHRQEIHVGNIIAERHQTMSLFTKSVKRLTEFCSGKKRIIASLGSLVKNPRMIADDYLAFQFGVAPLLSDVHSASVALAREVVGDRIELVFRSNSRSSINESYSTPIGNYQIIGTVNVSYVLRFRVANDIGRFLSSYGLINPLEIAWEVLPWSFVIDWILPVGKYLSDQTSTVGLDYDTGVKTVTFDYLRLSTQAEPAEFDADPALWINHWSAFALPLQQPLLQDSYHRNSKKRVLVSNDEVINTIHSGKAVVKNPFSWTHSLEALALTVQRLFR